MPSITMVDSGIRQPKVTNRCQIMWCAFKVAYFCCELMKDEFRLLNRLICR
jgi:hypothetical protein